MAKQSYTDPWLITADEDKEKTFSLKNSNDLEPLILPGTMNKHPVNFDI